MPFFSLSISTVIILLCACGKRKSKPSQMLIAPRAYYGGTFGTLACKLLMLQDQFAFLSWSYFTCTEWLPRPHSAVWWSNILLPLHQHSSHPSSTPTDQADEANEQLRFFLGQALFHVSKGASFRTSDDCSIRNSIPSVVTEAKAIPQLHPPIDFLP